MASEIAHVIVFATIVLSVIHASHAAPSAALCQSGIIEEMPPHIKKVCMALDNSEQLTSALKTYINNESGRLVSKADDLVNYGKRTDVDHIFLRFGKRR